MENIRLILTVALFTFSITSTGLASIQIDIPGPPNSVTFGDEVFSLPNGNIVVKDRGYIPPGASLGATAAGAVHLIDGTTLQIISTLTGNQAEDDVGRNIHILPNGDFVVDSNTWANGGMLGAGAVTHCSRTTGCNGTINASNSLLGTTAGDRVGQVIVLPNSNYVILSRTWHEVTSAKLGGGTPGVGAVTFCNGSTGCTGVVSAENSVLGASLNDFQDTRIDILPDGDYLIRARVWDSVSVSDVGAVRKCSGTTGCTGPISSTNSLVGSSDSDRIGSDSVFLPNGGYAVISTSFSLDSFAGGGAITNAGAVTFCNTALGCTGTISAANSLVGSSAGDGVGGSGVEVLPNGKVLVVSRNWDNAGVVDAGAVTICTSTTQCTGTVTTANSLHGVAAGDTVGYYVEVLANGNWVVRSGWISGVGIHPGAVTFCDATTDCTGPVTTSNSLHGSAGSNEKIGIDGVIALPNGNYLVKSSAWDSDTAIDTGAVTFCNGTSGCVGEVDASNSLTGIDSGDALGQFSNMILSNGNFVVETRFAGPQDRGAVTFCSGTAGCPLGPVNASNSLVGENDQDSVGGRGVLALDNGNYVVFSPGWNRPMATASGVPAGDQGAVTLCNGTSGCTGFITETNSLVGTNDLDRVGSQGGVALGNNYVVSSPNWGGFPGLSLEGPTDPAFGAATFCQGPSGCIGEITPENSLVGESNDTELGNGGIERLSNGDYIVITGTNLNLTGGGPVGPSSITYGDGTNGTVGTPNSDNTIFSVASGFDWEYDSVNDQIIAGRPGDNIVTLFRNSVPQPAPYDFDGDGRTDISIFRPGNGTWWIDQSADGVLAAQFGASGDVLAPADYDGDGKTDIAVWRAGPPTQARFYILNSTDFSVTETPFGQTGDDPVVVGDWDGDGIADPAVYRDSASGAQSRFYYLGSDNNPGNNVTFLDWGAAGDRPAKGDFDGDSKQDLAIFRPSTTEWWIKNSSDSSVITIVWGLDSDILTPGDYDGDSKTDLAVFRESAGVWYYRKSTNLDTLKLSWGATGDIPVPGDYDGDGRIDPAVFRPSDSTWYVLSSGAGSPIYQTFGISTDTPVPAAGVTN